MRPGAVPVVRSDDDCVGLWDVAGVAARTTGCVFMLEHMHWHWQQLLCCLGLGEMLPPNIPH